LQLRIGRQELKLGSGWLVSGNNTPPFNTGLSWDSILLSYVGDTFNVNALYAKPYEASPTETDGDIDVYAAFASYTGIENITLDTYWIWARDARSQRDTSLSWVDEQLEDLIGVDNYDVTSLHTIGLRGAGTYGAFDFESEVAYQFGDASVVGRSFAGAGLRSPYGDDSASYDALGANLEIGYTFDVAYKLRVFVGSAYFGGEDNRDLNFIEWLEAIASPFYREKASASFDRLFSGWKYSYFLDAYGDLSNVWIARFGASANPLENLKVSLSGSHFESLANYDAPWPTFSVFGTRIVPFSALTFLSKENSGDLGWEVVLNANYSYSEDLTFEVGYAHLFVGDGLAQGNFNNNNGLTFNGGTAQDDPDYLYFQTKLTF